VLYEIEREVRDLEPDLRRRIRQEKAAPAMDALHTWMITQRECMYDGVAIAKAFDYSLKRWTALSRYLDDGAAPINKGSPEKTVR
jgi:transposase